jgi:hypothetical protein
MITKYKSGYIHTAYATDASGGNFSTAAYDGALYIGTYTDANSAENADYSAYNWEPIADIVQDDADIAADYADDATTEVNDETADDEIETTDDTAGAVVGSATPTGDDTGTDDETDATADNVARLETAVQLNADSTTNTITNPNIISGTNNGAAGWYVGSGINVSTLSDPVYADTAISCARFTCSTAGSHYAFFPSDDLVAALAEQTQNYTLSFDCRASTPFPAPVKVCDSAAGNTLLTFDNMDFTTDDNDYAGVWVHYSSTAVSSGGAAASQGVYFDLSNMPASASLDIANLKVEDGAIDTPWKMSAKEAGETANAAKTTAETAKTTAENAATAAADAAKTASNYITDETNGIFVHPQSNTTDGVKITSTVDIVKSGVVLASYGDGVTLGDSTQAGYMQIKNGQIAIRFNNSALNESGWIEFGTGDSTNTNVLNIWANAGSVISTILNLDLDGNATFGGNVETAGNILSSRNVTAGRNVSANNLKCGTTIITPTAAGAVTAETIYFDKSFDTAPVVVCNVVSTRPDKCTCAPSSVTADSFVLNFYRDTKTATRINWFAFATS